MQNKTDNHMKYLFHYDDNKVHIGINFYRSFLCKHL
jgi:hypothetical protein